MRENRGLSQRNASIATGLTEETLFSLELGKPESPTLKTLKTVANYYGVPMADLIDKK